MDLLSVITPYEASILETVDDLELFAWWHETRADPARQWARLLPENFAVELFDHGFRSVRALISGRSGPILRAFCQDYPGFDPSLAVRIRAAAAAWDPWPEAFRRHLAAQHSLRYEAP